MNRRTTWQKRIAIVVLFSMLLSLFLGVYMTTAKAAFVSDLTAAAPSDNASGKMTE